ncbi:hypothetical protein [Phytohabitans rumicis]|uniref:Uncharacterized protein n=1 Tax=Phytohabitans rumicis TaxID=1076125 RepID=A0A6V8LAC4_9ACTN|nr:hypothetical protein [Phytohabitans rumicis]GFJ94162.1 hypothetical protein Prum_078040 [Phytohabitans rumicis]
MTGTRLGEASLAWLCHPVTVVATFILLINDHVLKAAAPGLVTGKLSDVAGLVAAPALVAFVAGLVAPRLPGHAGALGALGLTGLAFAAVKATSAGAAAASATWSLVRAGSVIRADRTDLLTLPALALAWWAYHLSRREPAPERLVRAVRLAVVLPLVTLAVAATSAAAYPTANRVMVRDGVLLAAGGETFQVGGRYVHVIATTDGRTWRVATEAEQQALNMSTPSTMACAGTECFRIVEGAMRVEQSVDGGATWATAWSLSEGRRRFLARAYPEPATGPFVSVAVAALPRPGGSVVAVANGRDGLLVRDGSGQWRRVGFPVPVEAPAGYRASPVPALTERGARLASEYLVAMLTIAVAVGFGLLGGGRPGRWLLAIPVGLTVGLAMVLFAGASVFLGMPALGIVVVNALLIVAGVAAYALGGGAHVARAAVVLLLGAGTVMVAMQPMIGWSAGSPDDHTTAARLAVLLGGIGMVATIAVGQLTRLAWPRPRSDLVATLRE